MVILGIDAHKRSHTVVVVDEQGRKLGERSSTAISSGHLALLAWAEGFGCSRLWAVEDCRHLSRRLEQDLLGAGETIVRVPPKLMAHSRDAARTFGKSDPIDALAVARAALREPQLPTAHLDGRDREVRLLLAHREDLVAERTRIINRLSDGTSTRSILRGNLQHGGSSNPSTMPPWSATWKAFRGW